MEAFILVISAAGCAFASETTKGYAFPGGEAVQNEKPTGSGLGREARRNLAEGITAFENGDYRVALAKLTPLAEDDDVAMAQNVLGRMYWNGQGVKRDVNKALLMFRKAVKHNLPNAQNNLGTMYAAGEGVPQDFNQAVFWTRKAADQGFGIAMSNLANFYDNGFGVKRDPIEAEKWRSKARGLDVAKSSDFVTIKLPGSTDYEKGLELYYQFKLREAFAPFLSAAKEGHPEAQLKLESMYRNGQGVEKDESQARYWAKQAAAQGYSNSDGRDRIFINDASPEEVRRMVVQGDATHVARSINEMAGDANIGVITNLAADAQIEAIGVYQGAAAVAQMSSQGTRRMGYVAVRIGRSERPVVLVLISHEPVRWALTLESGARLAAVLVSGYSQSDVVGAGDAQLATIGKAYAHERRSAEFAALDQEAIKWTGKNIDVFQGQYEGSSFRVGGR